MLKLLTVCDKPENPTIILLMIGYCEKLIYNIIFN